MAEPVIAKFFDSPEFKSVIAKANAKEALSNAYISPLGRIVVASVSGGFGEPGSRCQIGPTVVAGE